ncbi:hypothetical protein K435DRAFT_871449 [Dendrothele bispora CBS 962.96]|uniref:Uncharacterized protein n=1 Tax=Dendrothele bispora (strain CBS 962.96) TaxID=1314807 RepID=A0A4S8L423_DENBC|nr:hypothetical protein K435DRAFT_871449 [Dendrothele bispora CBS 962.96]
MPPNTPHVVLTTKHALCVGQHFISVGRIRDSVIGSWFTLFCRWLTNTAHSSYRRSLVFILAFWCRTMVIKENRYLEKVKNPSERPLHTPDITKFRELNDVLILINWVDLGTLQVPERYGKQGANEKDCLLFAFGSRSAWRLLEWLSKTVHIKIEAGSGEAEIMDVLRYRKQLLAQQAAALVKLAPKRKDIEHLVKDQTVCKEDFQRGIDKDFLSVKDQDWVEEFGRAWKRWTESSWDSLSPWSEVPQSGIFSVVAQPMPESMALDCMQWEAKLYYAGRVGEFDE